MLFYDKMLTTMKRRHLRKQEHVRFDFYFYPARPWYDKNGNGVFDREGVPIMLTDVKKLKDGFESVFAAIGATGFGVDEKLKWRNCENPDCKEVFEAKRSTARFCPECREDAYLIRTLTDPDYAALNVKRVEASRKKRRIAALETKQARRRGEWASGIS
jgi:ssDNA-binding Zn-finger/Zn-ribbon topoisomerase 1